MKNFLNSNGLQTFVVAITAYLAWHVAVAQNKINENLYILNKIQNQDLISPNISLTMLSSGVYRVTNSGKSEIILKKIILNEFSKGLGCSSTSTEIKIKPGSEWQYDSQFTRDAIIAPHTLLSTVFDIDLIVTNILNETYTRHYLYRISGEKSGHKQKISQEIYGNDLDVVCKDK